MIYAKNVWKVREDIHFVHRAQKIKRQIQPDDEETKISQSPMVGDWRRAHQSLHAVHAHGRENKQITDDE